MFKNKKAFTLAEALISLTVLGVIASISLPIVITNYNDHANIAAQKAMGLDLTHAMQSIIAEDGSLNKLQAKGDYNTFNEAFVKEKLVNALKITKICTPNVTNPASSDAVQKCGFKYNQNDYKPQYLTFDRVGEPNFDLSSLWNRNFFGQSFLDETGFVQNIINYTDLAYPIALANGASAQVMYNPQCRRPVGNEGTNAHGSWSPELACVNIVYDVNGAKGPNQVGRDIGFFTAFYPTKTVFGAPVLYEGGIDPNGETTTLEGDNSATQYCADLAPNNKAGIPTYEEAASIYINASLIKQGEFNRDSLNNDLLILNKKNNSNDQGYFACVHQ